MWTQKKNYCCNDRLIVHKIKSNRRFSADKVKVKIESELRASLNVNTIGNRAHEAGLFDCVALKNPLVNKVNWGKQLKYAKSILNKSIGFWETVIWSDESKFNLFVSDDKVTVR